MAVELYDHQKKAVEQMKDGCVLWGGVGTGKTITALSYYLKHHSGKDLYVITTARKRDELDWQKEAALFGIGPEGATVAGALTVDSWNNIQKYSTTKGAFFIFDEQRLVGKGAWAKTFFKLAKFNKWVLLSGTPGDTWMDYCPVFVANGFFKNRTDFIRQHVVYNQFTKFPSIDRYVETGVLNRYRKSILVHMPYRRRTVRRVSTVPVPHDNTTFERIAKDRWNPYEEKPIDDVGELFRLMRVCVNSDPSRVKKVRELYEKHGKVIVFYNFNFELEDLRAGLEGIEFAEWNGHKHEPIPEKPRWVYLVQYTAGAEGWNCIATDAMVFYSLNHSWKLFEQAQGRIDRLNTPFTDLHYYVLRSNTLIDHRIWRALQEKRDFNLSDLGVSF